MEFNCIVIYVKTFYIPYRQENIYKAQGNKINTKYLITYLDMEKIYRDIPKGK